MNDSTRSLSSSSSARHPRVLFGRVPDERRSKREQVGVGDRLDRGRQGERRREHRDDADEGAGTAIAHGHRPPVGHRHVHADESEDDDLEVWGGVALAVEHGSRGGSQPQGIGGDVGDDLRRQRAKVRRLDRGARGAIEWPTARRRGDSRHLIDG
jgi:hypothetical protein